MDHPVSQSHLKGLVIDPPVDIELGDGLSGAVGHQVDVAPHVGDVDALQLGNVPPRDVEAARLLDKHVRGCTNTRKIDCPTCV